MARRGGEARAPGGPAGGRADGNFALDISLIPGHGAVCSCHGEHGAPARRAEWVGGKTGDEKKNETEIKKKERERASGSTARGCVRRGEGRRAGSGRDRRARSTRRARADGRGEGRGPRTVCAGQGGPVGMREKKKPVRIRARLPGLTLCPCVL